MSVKITIGGFCYRQKVETNNCNFQQLDKVSVLGDAIKYIKELQERVRTLEEVDQEQTKRLENKELKKERVSGHDEDSSSLSDSDCETGTAIALPEIEVRASGQNLLIRVHCNNLHNHGGVIKEIFSEIERLHLSINTSHVMHSCPLATPPT